MRFDLVDTQSTSKLPYYPLGVTDKKTVDAMLSKFIPTLRYPVRGLVFAAGMGCLGSATMFDAVKFRHVLDTNATWTFLVAQATARAMEKDNVSCSMMLISNIGGYGGYKVDTFCSSSVS